MKRKRRSLSLFRLLIILDAQAMRRLVAPRSQMFLKSVKGHMFNHSLKSSKIKVQNWIQVYLAQFQISKTSWTKMLTVKRDHNINQPNFKMNCMETTKTWMVSTCNIRLKSLNKFQITQKLRHTEKEDSRLGKVLSTHLSEPE